MGGLQRSGTTWLEGLVASPRVSGLSFDNVDMLAYHRQQPWLLQNHTQEYFEMVVRSGGVEGKFVQDAYPYAYLVRDVGKHGVALDSLLVDSRAASARTAERLYDEWSLFWDTSKPVLLEKTPENLLMGPFLQAAFGAATTKFAFVMRHPLVWALAIEKWIFPDFSALRTVEDRIAFWFDCMTRAVEHLPQLRNAIVMQLETASASSELQRAISGHLLCTADEHTASGANASSDVRSLAPPEASGESTEILASSLAYVTCWLSGMEFKSSMRRCVARKSFRDPAFRQQPEQLALDNRWRLRQLARQREAQANQFGYTFRPFLALARKPTSAVLRERVTMGAPESMAQQLGVASGVAAVRGTLRTHLAVIPPSPPKAQGSADLSPPAASANPGVILVYHKMGFDRERPSGMDLRMTQIVNSLVSLQHTVHFVCHCDVHASQLSPFEGAVTIYTGTLEEQFSQAVEAATPLRSILIFFTTLTMSVHQRMLQGEVDWYAEPTTPLPEEQVLSWVRSRPAVTACTVAVADDIHFLRAIEVMARHDANKARMASEWIRRRELGFHSAVDGTATVSLEDAETLNRALATRVPVVARTPRCSSGMTWVPYVQATRSEASIEPFERRHEGMLYVGGMHGLAVIAIEWLLQKVQPLIGRSSARGDAELRKGGKGHLHLAGPGWAQHAEQSSVLNESVAAGYATILGTLSDLQLEQRLREHKVFVAPVLNGTGIATKNVLAMAHGIPLVTTLIGLNGLGLPSDQRAILVADSPTGFANHVVDVQSSESVFNVTWRAALQHTRTYLSADRQQAQLCRIIGCAAQAQHAPPSRAPSSREGASHLLLCDEHGPRDQLHRASQDAPAPLNRSGVPVVLLGLAGTNVSALASALRTPRVCLVADPLQGLHRAPLRAQLEHLQSLLTDPSYCQSAGQDAGRPEPSHTQLQGFAIELAPVEQVPTSLLATVEGLRQLSVLLAQAKVVVVRRCPSVAWAVERLLPPPGHCAAAGTCTAVSAQHRSTSLAPADVAKEMEACAAQDEAMRTVLEASAPESMPFFAEWRSGHTASVAEQVAQLKAFLRLPHAHPVAAAVKAIMPASHDWTSSVGNVQEIKAYLDTHGPAAAMAANCSTTAPPAVAGAASTSVAAALGTLSSHTRRRRPLLVVGAHGVEGGASLIGKALTEACREHLTPRLGWRCVIRDSFESCDPEADLCFLKQAHFSAGRYADRGYRFVHVVRSPIDMLTRSFQLEEPNATHTMNATGLLAALEAHWKALSGGLLHTMQDMVEAHASDPHARVVRLEHLLPDGRANATLATLFGFLLDIDPSEAQVEAVVASVAKVVPLAGRAELQGESQRKHMAKLLLRKPAKCQHVSRMQQALGYAPLTCTESVKGHGMAAVGDGDERGARRATKRRRIRRRLAEIDEPRSRSWRLAAAWV